MQSLDKNWWLIVFCFVFFFFLFIITKSLKRRLERRVAFASLRFFPVLLLCVPYAKFGVKLVTYCFFCFDSLFILIIITKSPKWRLETYCFVCFVSFFLLLIITKSPKCIDSFIRKSPKRRLERRDAFALFLFLSTCIIM